MNTPLARRQRVVLLGNVFLLALCLAGSGCARKPGGLDVKMEFRLAQTTPGENLTEFVHIPTGERFFVQRDVFLDESHVASARVVAADSQPTVELTLTPEGRAIFARETERHVSEHVAMLVDGRLIAAPIVRAPIASGRARLMGDLTQEEAERIARALNARAE